MFEKVAKFLIGYGVPHPFKLRDEKEHWKWSISRQRWVITGYAGIAR